MCYPPGRPDDTYYTGPTTPTPVSPVLPREERDAIRAPRPHRPEGNTMSTDETPTTERVRFAFIDREDFDAQVAHMERPTDEESGAAFDRWLAEHDRQVAERAWDEGAHAAFDIGARRDILAGNPYRADSAAPARPTTDDREALAEVLAPHMRVGDEVDGTFYCAENDGDHGAHHLADVALAWFASRPTTPTPTVSEERRRHPLMAAEGEPICGVRAGRYTCALPSEHTGAHLGVEPTTDGGEE